MRYGHALAAMALALMATHALSSCSDADAIRPAEAPSEGAVDRSPASTVPYEDRFSDACSNAYRPIGSTTISWVDALDGDPSCRDIPPAGDVTILTYLRTKPVPNTPSRALDAHPSPNMPDGDPPHRTRSVVEDGRRMDPTSGFSASHAQGRGDRLQMVFLNSERIGWRLY